ncbi:MAG: nucleotidyltransferase [Candidatus Brocadiales bacterium]
MTEELEVLKVVARRLKSADIPYMVTGSIALNFYSVPRMTRDIDLVIELSPQAVGKFCKLFKKDFYLSEEAVEEATKKPAVFNLIHNKSIVKVDFIVRKEDEYHKEEFQRRRPVAIEGTTIFLVSPEDLILSKLLWARDTDSAIQLRDVSNLFLSLKDLDKPYLQRHSLSLGLEELYRRALKACSERSGSE